MNIFKKSVFIFLLFSSLAFTFSSNKKANHEFHISKCQIDYNEEEKALQITVHLFIDDLEEALRQQGADKLFICTEKEDEKAEAYIYKYFQQRFKIRLEDEEINYTFLGKEMSEDMIAVWCYLEVENIESIDKMHIKNGMLMEAFEDQKNIISIVGPNKSKGYFLFDKGKNEETVSFESTNNH